MKRWLAKHGTYDPMMELGKALFLIGVLLFLIGLAYWTIVEIFK